RRRALWPGVPGRRPQWRYRADWPAGVARRGPRAALVGAAANARRRAAAVTREHEDRRAIGDARELVGPQLGVVVAAEHDAEPIGGAVAEVDPLVDVAGEVCWRAERSRFAAQIERTVAVRSDLP